MSTLSTYQRDTFARLADVLIPATGSLPTATGAGTQDGLIDDALSYRPDLAEAFTRALELTVDTEATVAVELLASSHPEEFFALTLLTTGAYYLSPTVRETLKYHQGTPRPVHDDVETYVDMLESVVERGPLYRATD
ncbi:hypothetical protein [Nocardioides zeae]|uniref:Gluconate 2-dehydrogenase subunit 3 family protein n=1 Tax=Nocardioides zeae TaxID=1457234 RepID=A0AAJ1X215_9ACTN|nr:hypothetical protein [Nocardioides zeae]MDQ1105456.1 hypothetical protein [Nocardioides zeae]